MLCEGSWIPAPMQWLCVLVVQIAAVFQAYVSWACSFQHTSPHFWVLGALNAPVTFGVPHWHLGYPAGMQGRVGLVKQRTYYCKSCFWTNAPCQCTYCSRIGVCGRGGGGHGARDPLWGYLYTACFVSEFWNITGDF